MVLVHISTVLLLTLLTIGYPAYAQTKDPGSDPLARLEVLAGRWEGEGTGFGRTSRVTHVWERVIAGRFMRLTTRSVSAGGDGGESVHEDIGFAGWSPDEDVLRFRQFLSEGFVNTFRIVAVGVPDGGFDFEPESTEGGGDMTARMTLRFLHPDVYEMVLELGSAGKPLTACQTMIMRRVR